jgi:Small Multidrug Resistance protein
MGTLAESRRGSCAGAMPSTRDEMGITRGTAPVLQGSAMAWVLFVVAGVLEIVWAFTMKLSQGLTRLGASVVLGESVNTARL